ncbi:DUF3055 domain-containing protein [uncultured Metabacillus sp.]|uniref:DUF3055 domain-containing protein n=1 Tax=uncultured Metabacillus sp. TaxID=2860135 RepID=UPI00263998E7|nr:DUF3055 domain-containing protein [uncultured Metabacillus sp.]
MELFETLYDEHERADVRFVGFTTDHIRYDFGIVYTQMFFGKPLVICMQSGRSALLDSSDIKNIEYLKKVFCISSLKEAEDVSLFFKQYLSTSFYIEQYT